MNCSATYTLSIWSPRLRPDEISAALGLAPDRSVLKGTDRIPPRHFPIAHGWHLTFEGDHDDRLEECLLQLIDRALPIKAKLDQLRIDEPDVACIITINLSRARTDLSLELSSDTIKTLSSLNASLFIDVADHE